MMSELCSHLQLLQLEPHGDAEHHTVPGRVVCRTEARRTVKTKGKGENVLLISSGETCNAFSIAEDLSVMCLVSVVLLIS